MPKIIGNTTATPNPQPNWTQTDSTKADYIKNKPEILTEEDIIELIDNNGGGSTPQIQSDWNQTDDTKVDYIKNKPITGDVITASIVDGVLVIKQNPHLVAKGEKGDPGVPGEPGQKGDSYILTEADKAEIAADVLAHMPSAEDISV